MKWALLVLACLCLLMCYRVGTLAANVNKRSGNISVLTEAASAYKFSALSAGIIGAASVVGATLIQISENKKKQ